MSDEDEVILTSEERMFALNVLALVVAAGGKIVVHPRDLEDLPRFKLVVSEDHATGSKVYIAVGLTPAANTTIVV